MSITPFTALACPLDGKPADDLILAELGKKISEAMPAIAPVPTIIDGEVTRLSFAEIQPLGSNIHFGATVDRVPVIVDGKTVSHLLLTVTGRDANQPILRRATIRLAPEELGGPIL